MEQTELVKPETLEDLIQTLHKLFESDSVNVEEVQSIMESYDSKPHEWMKYAEFDQYSQKCSFVLLSLDAMLELFLRWCLPVGVASAEGAGSTRANQSAAPGAHPLLSVLHHIPRASFQDAGLSLSSLKRT